MIWYQPILYDNYELAFRSKMAYEIIRDSIYARWLHTRKLLVREQRVDEISDLFGSPNQEDLRSFYELLQNSV